MSGLRDEIYQLLQEGWPHNYRDTLTAIQEETGICYHLTPPIYFVGDLDTVQDDFVLFVSLNPNIDPNSMDGQQEVASLVDVDLPSNAWDAQDVVRDAILSNPRKPRAFEQYFTGRCDYFLSDRFDWKFYRPHAAFTAGLLGRECPTDSDFTKDERAELLAHNAIAIDLLPFSGPHPPDVKQMRRWIARVNQGDVGYLPLLQAANLLLALVRARPRCVVCRYGGTHEILSAVAPDIGISTTTSADRTGTLALPGSDIAVPYTYFSAPRGTLSSNDAYERGRQFA